MPARIYVIKGVECVAATSSIVGELVADVVPGKTAANICGLCPFFDAVGFSVCDTECETNHTFAPIKYLPLLQMRGAYVQTEDH